MRSPLPLGALLLAACLACEGPAARPAGGPPQAVPAPAPPGGMVPAAALAFMREPIDTTITLGRWLQAHPADRIGDDLPEGANEERVCRLAVAEVIVAGHPMLRTAVFDLPEPPPGEVLPDSTKLAEHVCTLSAVWLTSREPDSTRAIAFADSVARTLAASLGVARSEAPMYGRGEARWLESRFWTTRGSTLALGVIPASVLRSAEAHPEAAKARDDGEEETAATHVAPVVPPSTVSVVSLTVYGASSDLRGWEAGEAREKGDASTFEDEVELANADSALAWTSPAVATALRPVLARVRRDAAPPRSAAGDSDLVRAVRVVHASAPSLDPPRRAAALYALDAVLWRSASRFDLDTAGRRPDLLLPLLRAAGAGYEEASLDEEAGNDRRDLRAAWDADSLSPGGQAALLALLRNGWYTGPACGHGFEPVIKEGEAAFLRGERHPLAHYAVGNAWNDVVALAHRAGDDYVDPKEYLPREREARQRAIEHFRLALAGLTDVGLRRSAWRSAVALMLGKSTGTRYFCVYD